MRSALSLFDDDGGKSHHGGKECMQHGQHVAEGAVATNL